MLSWAVLAVAVLATAPIKLDIRINTASSVSIQCEIAIYSFKMRFGGIVDWRFIFKKGESPFSLSRVIVLFRSIYAGAISRHLEISCRIGTGDACATAFLVGGVTILLGLFERSNAKFNIEPDFQNAMFRASGRCILLFRGGDIIIAGIRAFSDRLPIMLKGMNGNGKAKHRELDGHNDGKY